MIRSPSTAGDCTCILSPSGLLDDGVSRRVNIFDRLMRIAWYGQLPLKPAKNSGSAQQ
jgi:hypothetical protein